MKTPYLIAEIPSGPDGHIAVTEPGTPVGDDVVVGVVQRCRDQGSVVRPDVVSVARDTLQSTGRVGRSVLALCNVDAGRLTPEQLDDLKARLGHRLDSVGLLAQQESVRDARGAVASCKLLSVWAELDGLHKLPALQATPPTRPGTSSTDAETPPPVDLRRYAPIAAVAALALTALAYVAWSRSGPSSPETVEEQATSGGNPAVAPSGTTAEKGAAAKPAQAAVSPDFARLRDEIARARDQSFSFGANPDTDPGLAKLLKEWPGRLVGLVEGGGRELFPEYRDLLASRFKASARAAGARAVEQAAAATRGPKAGAATAAAAIKDLAVAVASHDRAFEVLGLSTPFQTYGEDLPTFANRSRAILRDVTLTSLHTIATGLLGRRGQEPPVGTWDDLKAVADVVGQLPRSMTEPGPTGVPDPAYQHLAEFARLVGALKACKVHALIALRLQSFDASTSPEIRLRWPTTVNITYPNVTYPDRKDLGKGERIQWHVERTVEREHPDISVVLAFSPAVDAPSVYPTADCRALVPELYDATFVISHANPTDEGKPVVFRLSGAKILEHNDETPSRSGGGLSWSVSATFQRIDGPGDLHLNPKRSPIDLLRGALGKLPAPDAASEGEGTGAGAGPAATEALR